VSSSELNILLRKLEAVATVNIEIIARIKAMTKIPINYVGIRFDSTKMAFTMDEDKFEMQSMSLRIQ